MCAKKESMKFDDIWEDCIQDEVRVANKEYVLKEYGQTLTTHTRRGRRQSRKEKPVRRKTTPNINAIAFIR